MNIHQNIIAATAVIGLLSVGHAGAMEAVPSSPKLTMRPLHGISFDVGTKRAASYYLNENGSCKLVLTLAAEPNWNDDVQSHTAIRFEAAIPAGKATHYNSDEGRVLEFTCHDGARTMTVRPVEQVAFDGLGG